MYRLPSFLLISVLIVHSANCYGDIVVGPFGANGQGGEVNGQTFSFGSGGSIYEIDSFINVSGYDLNGAQLGTSAQLSLNALPSGLSMNHSYSLSPDGTDLTIDYTFLNQVGSILQNVSFFVFVDPEIDVPSNTYFNEFAVTSGSLGFGQSDIDADYFEVDEPGYIFGDIFDNLRLGLLDDTNAINSAFPDDVSIALGFQLGDLAINQQRTISILISDDGDNYGGFFVKHHDADPNSTSTFSISGIAPLAVPEPSLPCVAALIVCALGCHRREIRRSFLN